MDRQGATMLGSTWARSRAPTTPVALIAAKARNSPRPRVRQHRTPLGTKRQSKLKMAQGRASVVRSRGRPTKRQQSGQRQATTSRGRYADIDDQFIKNACHALEHRLIMAMSPFRLRHFAQTAAGPKNPPFKSRDRSRSRYDDLATTGGSRSRLSSPHE